MQTKAENGSGPGNENWGAEGGSKSVGSGRLRSVPEVQRLVQLMRERRPKHLTHA